MVISFSKRQTLRQNLPSFLDGRKINWPNPEQSTGRQCVTINGLQCWQAIGPASEIMEKLSSPIKELLDKHQEVLEQGVSKPRAISFNMWMVGPITSANPTIVISSRNQRQRSCAKTLLKESKLLDDYPGVRIKTLDRMPAIYRAGEPILEGVDVNVSEPGIYVIDGSRGLCGALISYGQSRFATMGGSMLIDGIHYGFSAGHARFEPTLDHDDDFNMDDAPCFDDDSDSEGDDITEITSKGKVKVIIVQRQVADLRRKGSASPISDPGAHTDSSQSTFSTHVPDTKERTQKDDFPRLDTQTATPSNTVHYLQVHPLPESSAAIIDGDLDYELLALPQSRSPISNVIPLPGFQTKFPTYLTAKNVVRELVESTVYAATGTTGCVKGTILKSKHYIKMERSKTFQEMWVAKLERKTMRGDCGSWVVDATTGDVYGHIIAGDSLLDIAFIIPAYKVWDDIQRRFGAMPLLSTKQPLASSDSSHDPTETLSVASKDSDLFSNYSINSTAPTVSTRVTATTTRTPHQHALQGYRKPHKFVDTSGQIAPPGVNPRVTATLWEDEGCLCFLVNVKGVTVARREDNNMINGSKLLNVAGMTRGRRDGILKSQKTRQFVRSGPMHLKGFWIPFERALDFANAENITEALYPLFVHNIGTLRYHLDNQSRTSVVMAAAKCQRLDSSKQQNYAPDSTSSLDAPYSLPSFDGIYSPSPPPKTFATALNGSREEESTSSAGGSNHDDDRASFDHYKQPFQPTPSTSGSSTSPWLQDPRYSYGWGHETPAGHVQDIQRTPYGWGPETLAGHVQDIDKPGDLLKDPVAYAQNDMSGQLLRHPTNPQLPPSRFSGLSLSTTATTSPPIFGFTSPPRLQSPISAILPTSLNSIGPNAPYQLANQYYQRYNYPPVNPGNPNPPCNTLCVGNLPIDTSEDELKAMFSKQRGYKRLCFRTKQNGPICFVEFEDISFATKALNELYGHPLHNSVKGGIRLDFSKNPLGVRTGQPGSMGSRLLSPLGSRLETDIGDITSFPPLSPYQPDLIPPSRSRILDSRNGMTSYTSSRSGSRYNLGGTSRSGSRYNLGGTGSPKDGVTTGVGVPLTIPDHIHAE